MTTELTDDIREKFRELNKLLREHDWFHAHSDDPRAHRQGMEEFTTIRERVAELEGLGWDADRLFKAYHLTVFYPGSGFTHGWRKEETAPSTS